MSRSEPEFQKKRKNIGGWLRNFWVNLLLVLLGLLFGVFFPDWGKAIYPVGDLYLALLNMCIIPIVLTAIVSGLGEMLAKGAMRGYLKHIVAVYLIAVILGASLGVLAGWAGRPGEAMSVEARKALGKLMFTSNSGHMEEKNTQGGMTGFVRQAIPENVIKAMADGKSLAIVLAGILMGIALGLSRSEESRRVLEVTKGVLEIFNRILNWVLYALPFALFSLSATLTASSGWTIFSALSRILMLAFTCGFVMCVFYTVAIWFFTRHSVPHILSSLKDALGLAFFSNSLVAMPLAMQKLEEELHLPGPGVRMVLPLGTIMNRHIYPLLFALMTVMTAQFYGHTLTLVNVIHIVLASAFVGMAAVGNLAVVAPLVQEVMGPLGLPAGIAILILVQCTAVLNPVVKMIQLFGACATTAVICSRRLERSNL